MCEILKNLSYFYDEIPENIFWSYGIYDLTLERIASSIPKLKLIEGLPSQQFLEDNCSDSHNILVIDDLMLKLKENYKFTVNLASRFARHRKLSIFSISQNMYELPRSFNVNVSNILLTYPGKDKVSLRTLSAQLYPKKNSVLLKIWSDIVKNSTSGFPYVLINCTNNVDKHNKILTDIFEHQDTISYIIEDE